VAADGMIQRLELAPTETFRRSAARAGTWATRLEKMVAAYGRNRSRGDVYSVTPNL
jgi:hypothetical protein